VKKLTDINNLLNTKFTDELLSQKFAKQRNIALKYDPVHQANIKRKEIQKRRAEAEQQMDEEEIARCDAKLEDLDNEAANGISAVKAKIAQTASPAKPLAQHESLAQLNRKNRVKTQQEVRQALIAERKKIMKAREAALEKRTAEVKAKVHDKAHVLAQRRSSQHKELFGEATPDTSRAGTPANTASPVVKTRVDAPESNGAKGPIGALKKKNLDDDVIGSLDMDIDIEI
jgi:RNA polymerase-associated protein RTF1